MGKEITRPKQLPEEVRKRNRKILFVGTVFLVITHFVNSSYKELRFYHDEINNASEKEIFILEKKFLSRNQEFYNNEEYIRRHNLLKKEWETEQEGVKFYGKSQSEEQKYNVASVDEPDEFGTFDNN